MCVCVCVCARVCVCVYSHLCLKEIDESGQVVLILAAVSFQVTLNDQVTSLAHFLLLTLMGEEEEGVGRRGEEGKVGRGRRGQEREEGGEEGGGRREEEGEVKFQEG